MPVTAVSGKNGLIYVSATEIVGANSWSIAVEHESIQYAVFASEWQNTLSGIKSWSGNIGAVHDQAAKLLAAAAIADATVALLIYPDRSDLSTYYSGSAVFSYSSEASMDGVVGESADFTGHSTLTQTGFS